SANDLKPWISSFLMRMALPIDAGCDSHPAAHTPYRQGPIVLPKRPKAAGARHSRRPRQAGKKRPDVRKIVKPPANQPFFVREPLWVRRRRACGTPRGSGLRHLGAVA